MKSKSMLGVEPSSNACSGCGWAMSRDNALHYTFTLQHQSGAFTLWMQVVGEAAPYRGGPE
jgi:hypothetical protein